MRKETINYETFDGNTIKEDFYFNLTKAELMEMELGTEGGLAEKIQKVVDAQNTPELLKIFKDLVLLAYGVKSDDGKRFIKNQELRDAFAQTNAYSDLFMKLATDADAAAKFINDIVPADMGQQAQAQLQAKTNHPANN